MGRRHIARSDLADRAVDLSTAGLIGALRALPYGLRIPAMGAAARRTIGPLLGWPDRIREGLAIAMPDLPETEAERIVSGAMDQTGRSIIEMYSGEQFLRRVRPLPLTGDGVEALLEARDTGRPVVGVTAHFGNYNAARAAILAHGLRMGSLYRPMANPYFDRRYARVMAEMGGPMFPRGPSGLKGMLRHLKGGGMLAILADLYVQRATPLTFFGHEAPTALTAAEMAARHDALLVPFHGIRNPDGLSFTIRIGAEIPPGSHEARMQALNDDLERLVRDRPEQWFWQHRRWKPRKPQP